MSILAVLYQFSEEYAPFAGVSISTLLKNNQDIDELTVYIASKTVSEGNRAKLNQLSEEYHREFVFLNVDKIYDQINAMGCKNWNGSQATWMKMFVMSEIPNSVEQLLYLDSDTLIPGSLKELAELDLADYPVAAVIDSISPSSHLRLRLKNPYYNAGVIFFNLKNWRKNGTEKKMHEHLKGHITEYTVNDQDLLNDFFRGQILQLSPKYNFQGLHFVYRDEDYFPTMKWKKGFYYEPEEITAARKDIRIIHFFRFCGQYPWEKGTVHACKQYYEEALKDSPWKGYKAPERSLKPIFRIERMLYRVLPSKMFLHLMLKFAS